jgi:hypothetical protein
MKEQYKRIKSYSFSFKLIDKLKKPFDKEEANEHKKRLKIIALTIYLQS